MKNIQLFEIFENESTNFSEVFSKCTSISAVSLDTVKTTLKYYKKNLCIGFDEWMDKNSKRKISRYDWESGKWL